MVLYGVEGKKYFDLHLINHLRNKNNDGVVNILRTYRLSHPSVALAQLKDCSGSTLLHYAAEYGNAYFAQYLLDCKCDIDAQDNSGRSPLMLAVHGQHDLVFGALLQAGANICLANHRGENSLQLIFALKQKRLKMLKIFFQQVAWQKIIDSITTDDLAKKMDEIGCTSKTVLQWGNVDLMKLMLSREALIDARYYKGGKAMLHAAVELRKVEIVRALVERGADVDVFDYKNRMPVSYLYAGVRGHGVKDPAQILEILRVLASRATSSATSNALGEMQISGALVRGNDDVIEIILRSGVDLNVVDNLGNAVLHYLTRNVKVDLYKLTRGREFDVNVRDVDGNTPLHLAAWRDAFNNITFLLDNGADVGAVNEFGKTALSHLLEREGAVDKRSAEILLQHAVDPQAYVCFLRKLNSKIRYPAYFDYLTSRDKSAKAEPLLARLAIVQGLGTEITEYTRSLISLQPSWVKYFYECQRQVMRMKETVIYNRITLFKFATESRKKMIAHVRNEELVVELEKIVNKYYANSPYSDMIRRRYTEAVRLAESREKTVATLRRLINLQNNASYLIAENILEYLSVRDIENLHLVWND